MVGDTVSDFITRIKNASMVKKEHIEVPYSGLSFEIARKLQDRKFIGEIDRKGTGVKRKLHITLLYDKDGKSVVQDVKRLSKPGRRVYFGVSKIRPVKYGYGSLIMSTPKGILTGDEARKNHVGGEALFNIW